jgi:uncharacterized protein YndB with AHSA1/START domain
MSEDRKRAGVEPVRRTITVSWSVAAAFERFTRQMGTWWPLRSHSVSGANAESCVIEEHVGGRIYEVARDGRQCEWGTVLAWDPPHRVEFTWHPGSGPELASRVEVRFNEVAGGTRLDLTHTGWEVFGRNAERMRRLYHMGWLYVLNVWADRRHALVMLMFDLFILLAGPYLRWKQRRDERRDSSRTG